MVGMTTLCQCRHAGACVGGRGSGHGEDRIFRGLDYLSIDCRNSVAGLMVIHWKVKGVFA